MSWSGRDLNMLPATETALFLNNTILACAKKKEMIKHNIDKVKANMQPIAPHCSRVPRCSGQNQSAHQAAGLPMKTIISKNTNFRLTSKLWREAGQTNDSEEVIHYIIIRQPEKEFIPSRWYHRHVQQLHRAIIPSSLSQQRSHLPSNYIQTQWRMQVVSWLPGNPPPHVHDFVKSGGDTLLAPTFTSHLNLRLLERKKNPDTDSGYATDSSIVRRWNWHAGCSPPLLATHWAFIWANPECRIKGVCCRTPALRLHADQYVPRTLVSPLPKLWTLPTNYQAINVHQKKGWRGEIQTDWASDRWQIS